MVLHTPNLGVPYVQPTDTVTSYPVTSQELATGLDSGLFEPKYGLRAYRAAALTASATAGAVTPLPYDTEVYDQANAFAGGIYTCPVAGRYLVRASVSFSMLASEIAGCHLMKNGATDTLFLITAAVAQALQAQSVAIIMCAAGNTLSASMMNSVASKTVRAGATETFICVDYLGP
jgi:hypothetical protein